MLKQKEMSPIEETVRRFFIEHFLSGEGDTLKGDMSFLEAGLINSTRIFELVTFLEKMYDIKIEDGELVPQNFDTLDNIAMYVKTKTRLVG